MQPAQQDEEETQAGPTESDQIQLEEKEEEEYRSRVLRPFGAELDSLSTVKGQYMAIEEALVDISRTFGVPSLAVADHIKTLPKKREMEDLQA